MSSKPTLTERMNQLEELVKSGMERSFAAKIVGLTDEEVREALDVPKAAKLTDEVVVTALVSTAAKAKRGAENANERASKLERRLSEMEKFLGNENFTEALSAGREGGRKSFIAVLRNNHVSDDDIRRVLVILDDGEELNLSDEQLFYELYSSHVALRACVEQHDTRLTRVEETVENLDGSSHYPLWGVLAAPVAGIVVWLVVWLNPYGVHGTVTGSNGQATGTFDGGWQSGWLGFGLGILTAGVVLLLSARTTGSRRTLRTEEHSSSSSSNSSASATDANTATAVLPRYPGRAASDNEEAPASSSSS